MVRRMDRQREVLIWCRKCSPCETENGTEIDELLQAGASGHKRVWQDVKTNSDSRRRQDPCQVSKKLEDRRTKKKDYKERNTEDCGVNSELEHSWHKSRQRENVARQRCIAQGRRRHWQRIQGHT